MWRCVRRRGSGGFSAKNIQEFTQKHLNACAGVCYAYHEERSRAPAYAGALLIPVRGGSGPAIQYGIPGKEIHRQVIENHRVFAVRGGFAMITGR